MKNWSLKAGSQEIKIIFKIVLISCARDQDDFENRFDQLEKSS